MMTPDNHKLAMGSYFDAEVVGAKENHEAHGCLALLANWQVTCRGPDGEVKWRDTIGNEVFAEGSIYALGAALVGASPTTDWFVGLMSSSPATSSGHTLATHVGWTEVEDYTEAIRQLYVGSTVSSTGGTNNSASKASFEASTDIAVGGAFLCSASSGTAGTLYAGGAFTGGDKDLSSGDTLEVTATFNADDDA